MHENTPFCTITATPRGGAFSAKNASFCSVLLPQGVYCKLVVARKLCEIAMLAAQVVGSGILRVHCQPVLVVHGSS